MMDKVNEPKPKKKGFFALLKASMEKSSEGCGPECGCHAAPPPKVPVPPEAGKPMAEKKNPPAQGSCCGGGTEPTTPGSGGCCGG